MTKTTDDNDVARQIREETERETRMSRFRDPVSHDRVPPIANDFNRLARFASRRRRRTPGVLDALRGMAWRGDTRSVRFLANAVLKGGASNPTERRRCERVLAHCRTIELGLVVGDAALTILAREVGI